MNKERAVTDTTPANGVKVGVVMGSSSDWDVMRHAAEILTEFGVPLKPRWFLRTACPTTCSVMPRPRKAVGWWPSSPGPAVRAFARHGGGKTTVPVLGVPCLRATCKAWILCTPSCNAQGHSGGHVCHRHGWCGQRGLFAVAMLASGTPELLAWLEAFRARQTEVARAMTNDLTMDPKA